MERIKLTCGCCGKVWDLRKTNELSAHVFSLRCNYCPDCQEANRMEDYYNEWWDESENDPHDQPIPVGDNQLCLPFLFEEIGIKQIEKTTHSAIPA